MHSDSSQASSDPWLEEETATSQKKMGMIKEKLKTEYKEGE
jgi:hypothetical protein